MSQEVYITFPTIEGEIAEPIGKKLTIGSEVGELILEDESISPRHCTFIINKDVVSLIDHGSVDGTFLNRKKLEPARTFIVSEKDKIKIGAVQAKLEFRDAKAFAPKPETTEPGMVKTRMFDAQELSEHDIIDETYDDVMPDLPSADNLLASDHAEFEGDIQLGDEDADQTDSMLGLDVEDVTLVKENKTQSVGVSQLLNVQKDEAGDLVLEDQPKTVADNAPVKDKELAGLFSESNSHKEDRTNIATVDVERVELDPEVLKYLKIGGRFSLTSSRKKRSRNAQLNAKKGNKKEKVEAAGGKVKNRGASLKYYESSTHVVFRFFALFFDIVFCLSVVNIFYIYVDFKNFFLGLGQFYLDSLYTPFFKTYWVMGQEMIPMLQGLSKDIATHPKFDFILSMIIFVMGVRLLSTAAFGVSFGSFIIGIHSLGSGLFKRVAGFARELIGFVLGPLFIFDLPTYFSKRSVKEILTGTQLYHESRASSIFLTTFFLPIMILFYCFGPMAKGLEVLRAIEVVQVQKKITPWEYNVKLYSSLLGMSYDSSAALKTLPSFRIKKKDKKRYLTFGLVFVDTVKGKTLEIRKVKEFNMNSFYKGFAKENFLSQYFWPDIYAAANNVANDNKNFVAKKELSSSLIQETQKVLTHGYTLTLRKIPQFIIENGPLMAGHRDFREKYDSLFKDAPERLAFSNFGKIEGIIGKHRDLGDIVYSFVPLQEFQNKLYMLSLDPLSADNSLQVNHFKIEEKPVGVKEDPISRLALGFKQDPKFENLELAQLLYERYFDLAEWSLSSQNFDMKDFLIKNISTMIAVLGEYKEKNRKLYLNLNELLNALEKQNIDFFDIKKTRII